MQKSQRDDARSALPMRRVLPLPLLLMLLLLLASACAGNSLLGGGAGAHPPELVGEWLDSAKTRSADSSLWVFTATGDDQVRRVGASGAVLVHHYGYWFVRGALTSADRALCFTNRPGRSAPTCLPFDLDSVRTDGSVRKRMVVRGYRGAHTTGDRVLLEHR